MEYKKPSLTTDVVLFTFIEDKLKVLLIQRGKPPFAGDWAFPGGFSRLRRAASSRSFA